MVAYQKGNNLSRKDIVVNSNEHTASTIEQQQQTTAVDNYYDLLRNVSLLVVGAGGIGCELIKNLVLCGVRNLVIVDIDTIDVSNLNRQFLYRAEDVGRYKAEVARDALLKWVPKCKVTAEVCDVLKWRPIDLSKYDVVLNALDNIRARSHINYCCMRAGIPLIEAGSTGYNGQVYPIVHGITACYDCHEKPRNKDIPVCSVRQIPEKAEHCVAWARQLYELIFGPDNDNNMLHDLDIPQIPDVDSITDSTAQKWVRDIFEYLFDTQITQLLTLDKVWAERQPPRPIKYPLHDESTSSFVKNGVNPSSISDMCSDERSNTDSSLFGEDLPPTKMRKTGNQHMVSHCKPTVHEETHNHSFGLKTMEYSNNSDISHRLVVKTMDELVKQFRSALLGFISHRKNILGSAIFDKEDPICVDFVSSAANLRMINFNIPHLSTWDVQSIAGSITPAIAATNAIVAATQVMQLIHLLTTRHISPGHSADYSLLRDKCKFVWIKSAVAGSAPLTRGALSSPEPLDEPNPKCAVCQQKVICVELRSLDDWTLESFASTICKMHMGMTMVNIDFDGRNLLDAEFMEEDESYSAKMQNTPLKQYGIVYGSILMVTCLDSGRQEEMQILEGLSTSADKFRLID
uniref:SUMO-activating enzyme subunit n=2 Tax=Babesia bovis TaxID=5865 RepID=A7AV76_BABBO|eukprot:XP_001609270.1 ubiquitin-activating enzyme [Babesia bovis T2Bo]